MRFGINESDNYGTGKSNYFSLKDDKDTAVIRFLYNDINDVEGVACHSVEVDGKRMHVECLRAYNEPLSKCPLCEAGYKVDAKLFIPVYDENAKESKIWTRGKTFFSKLSSLCSRYNPLVSTPFEVERNGKTGDTNTTYEVYPLTADNARIEDFPEIKADDVAFQCKTFDELTTYLQTGNFGDNKVLERNNARNNMPQRQSAPTQREMPATPVRRRPQYNNEDTF